MVLLVLCLGSFAYGCGGNDDGVTQKDIDDAIQKERERQNQEERVDELKQQIQQLKKQTGERSTEANRNAGQGDGYYGNSASGGPVSTCATGVQVGPNTSCSFAMNVAGEYGSNPGASSITAYSPVTGQRYTMSCGPWGSSTVCTGGNGASVYLP